jgi:MAF protein
MSRSLVLASTSPWRRAQLERFGLVFSIDDPRVDEAAAKADDLDVRDLVVRLATSKARAVAERHPDALVIAGDQAVDLDGDELGKPGTAARAVDQLMRLQGRSHHLRTALCVLDTYTGAIRTALESTTLTMRSLTRDEAARYVALDDPISCAGSYRIESRGPSLFTDIRGTDPTAIEGVPLVRLGELLRAHGFDLFGRDS